MKKCLCLFIGLLLFPFYLLAGVRLVENNQALAEIVLPEDSASLLKFAAEELQFHLEKLSGVKIPIVQQRSDKLAIFLGEAAAQEAGFTIVHLPEDSFLISVAENAIHIAGKDNPSKARLNFFHLFYDELERATLFGVYQFLEKFAIVWASPNYTYYPEKPKLELPIGQEYISPSFAHRNGSIGWNFMNVYPDALEFAEDVNEAYRWGLRLRFSNRSMVMGAHSENSLKLRNIWKDYPERFMMNADGSRNFNYLCWTDPAVTEMWLKIAEAYFTGLGPEAVGLKDLKGYLHSKWPYPFSQKNEIMIDPHDHDGVTDGRCRCPRCNAFREKYPSKDDTEIIWKVIVEVAEMLKEKFPGKYVSTLIYPPKMEMPKYVKIPDNVRVRICISGPKEIATPARLESDLQLVRDWEQLVGAANLPLWTYQCIIHARRLPGPPEVYPHLTNEFLKKISDITAGMYLEMHSLTFTYHWLDTYILARLMWDKNLDVDKEIEKFFNATFGPAANEAQKLFARFEENWLKLWKLEYPNLPRSQRSSLGVSGSKEDFQKQTWRDVYHLEEMRNIDHQIKNIENICADNKLFSKHAAMLRKHVFEVMQAERSEVMDKEERRSNIVLEVKNTTIAANSKFPAEEAWAKVPIHKMRAASRLNTKLAAGGSFKVLKADEKLFIRADFEEPLLSKSRTVKGRKIGDMNIWRDNDAEIFIYQVENNFFWQFIINDEGKWAAQCLANKPGKWSDYPGLEVLTEKTANGWRMQASIPLQNLGKGEWRFNLTRGRNVEGATEEYSTWSELAMLGNWHEADNYGTIIFKD